MFVRGAHAKAEPVVFATAFEGLFERGVGPRLNERAKEQLFGIGVDVSKPFLPAYTVEQWVEAIRIASECLYPELPKDEAEFQLGRDFVAGVKHTVIGRAMFAYGVAVGPRRTMERMSSNFRYCNNYIESELIEDDRGMVLETRIAKELLPKFQGRPIPSCEYMRGVLHAVLELGGMKDVYVERLAEEPELRLNRYRLHFHQ